MRADRPAPLDAVTLVPGAAEGEVLPLTAPLSFWGGFDPATGAVTDRFHPQHGLFLTGRALAMTGGRGSSSGSSVLAEAIRCGTAPAAIVLAERDAILIVGAMVARALYDAACPILLVEPAGLARLASMGRVRITADGHGARIIPLPPAPRARRSGRAAPPPRGR